LIALSGRLTTSVFYLETLPRKSMSFDNDIAMFPGTTNDKSIVYVSWREDFWQQGDPMFDAIENPHQIYTDRNQQVPLTPPVESYGAIETQK
jgi:hypothetical protein